MDVLVTRACYISFFLRVLHLLFSDTPKARLFFIKKGALFIQNTQKLDDEELASYIITGLDREYNFVVSALLARVEPIGYNRLLA